MTKLTPKNAIAGICRPVDRCRFLFTRIMRMDLAEPPLVLSITNTSFPIVGTTLDITELTILIGNSADAKNPCICLIRLLAGFIESNPAHTIIKRIAHPLHRVLTKG